MSKVVKFVVFVPESHANNVRQALGLVGAGKVGNYDFSTFSTKGTGRFRPLQNAKPTIGKVGKLEAVAEERIETVCYKKHLPKIIKAVKKAHPYEHIAFDVYPLLSDPVEDGAS